MSSNKRVLTEAQVEKRAAVIDTLKSLIFPCVVCAVIAVFVLFVINIANEEAEPVVVQPYAYSGDGSEIILENDELILTMDSLTTAFTVTQKSSGKVWTSTAIGGESDPIALSTEKNRLQSNLLLTYSIETGLDTTYDSFSFSVENGIYELEVVDNKTIKVYYSLGKVEKEYVVPPVLTAEDMDYWKSQMPTDKSGVVSEYYKKYDINKLGKKDNKEELIEKYPIIEETVIYVLRDTTKEQMKKSLEETFENAGYTYEDYLEDKELDNAEKTSDKPVFNVEMDLTLDGSDLIVEVPFNSIEHMNDTYVTKIALLPYFAAANTDAEGYILVPEGGGAIMNYNNGKNSQNNYYANVYGWDMDLVRADVVHNTRAYFNVFGQATENNSYLCIMEDGASYASISADISGRTNSYNYVYAEYSISSREKYDIGEIANSDVYVYREELPDEKIVQRYKFIQSDDYVKMAEVYREYLKAEFGSYFTLNNDANVPVALEVVGAVDKVKQIVGVPVSRPLELTNFKEAQDMIIDLSNSGVRNMSVKYTGWCNGGVSQKLLKNISIVNGLGGKNGLKKLITTGAAADAEIYLNGITQYEHRSNIFNGFFSYRDAARFLTKERSELHQYSHVTYAMRESSEPYYLLHTELANQMAENLQNYTLKVGAGVAFEDLGMDLSSDFYRKKMYSREDVKKMHVEMLKGMKDEGSSIMINMGNDYAIGYADMVTGMDLKGSEYTILDAEVPFYQLAVHGYVNYTGDSINVCGNEQDELLASVEYGAGLSFTLMDETPFTLQKTLYTEYYGAEYDSWKDRLVEIYTRYNSELGKVFNQEMIKHEVISENVRCTTYADGTRVYVNYSFTEEYHDREGGTVAPRDYRVEHVRF